MAPRTCLQGTDALIAEIFHKSGREYGCRKMAAVLGRMGVSMNFKTVNHRMRSMGLRCVYRRREADCQGRRYLRTEKAAMTCMRTVTERSDLALSRERVGCG